MVWIKSKTGYWYDLNKAKWIRLKRPNTINIWFEGEDTYEFSVDKETYKLVEKWLERLHELDKRDLGVEE